MVKIAHVKGKKDDGTLLLGCDEAACEGCRSKLFCSQRGQVFEADNPTGADWPESQGVTIEMPFSKTILALVIVYVAPLALMGLGLALSHVLGAKAAIQAVAAIVSLAVGMGLSAALSRICSGRLKPAITGAADDSAGKAGSAATIDG